MHFLLVNDDGIHAPGIHALCKAAIEAGHIVSVCAPDTERSAVSHAITLKRELHAVSYPFEGALNAYAVDGTPADCARLGLFLCHDIDMVLSGINNGANMGGACIYSGTVGAAMEASMSGTQAIAISQQGYNRDDYSVSAKIGIRFAEWAEKHKLNRGDIYNINIPELPLEKIKGFRASTLAQTYFDSPNYAIQDAGEAQSYVYEEGINAEAFDPNCDVEATANGFIPVTKLSWNLQSKEANPNLTDLIL